MYRWALEVLKVTDPRRSSSAEIREDGGTRSREKKNEDDQGQTRQVERVLRRMCGHVPYVCLHGNRVYTYACVNFPTVDVQTNSDLNSARPTDLLPCRANSRIVDLCREPQRRQGLAEMGGKGGQVEYHQCL